MLASNLKVKFFNFHFKYEQIDFKIVPQTLFYQLLSYKLIQQSGDETVVGKIRNIGHLVGNVNIW